MSSAFAPRGMDAGQAEIQAESSCFRGALSVQGLVAPVSQEEFLSRYWERKPLILHRQDPGYYGDLFTLEDFDSAITNGPGYVKTAEATAKKSTKHEGSMAQGLEGLLNDMRGGHTLILDTMRSEERRVGKECA